MIAANISWKHCARSGYGQSLLRHPERDTARGFLRQAERPGQCSAGFLQT